MRVRDWLVAGTFLVVCIAAMITVVVVVGHSRTHRTVTTRYGRENLHVCYQNLGNGGC